MRESFRMGNSYYLDGIIKGKIIRMLELANPVELADQVAEEFTKQYYMYMNEQRNMISRMYLDDAILTFQTTDIAGKHKIQKFWLDMPCSEHTVLSLTNVKQSGHLTFMFKVRGEMKYKDRSRSFFQYFLITKHDLTGKIIRSCFRMLYCDKS